MEEFVWSFRFEGEPGQDVIDAIRGAVRTICEIHGVQAPIETVGEPPLAAFVPGVAAIESLIHQREMQNVTTSSGTA